MRDAGDGAQAKNRCPRQREYLLDVTDVLREAGASAKLVVADLAAQTQRDAPRGEEASVEGVAPELRGGRVIRSLLRGVGIGNTEVRVDVLETAPYADDRRA